MDYSKVYSNFSIVSSNSVEYPDGTAYFTPAVRHVRIGHTIQHVQDQTWDIVDGQIVVPHGNYVSIPATEEGLDWYVFVSFDGYNMEARFVVKSYAGDETTIGD